MIRRLEDLAWDSDDHARFVDRLVKCFGGDWTEAQEYWEIVVTWTLEIPAVRNSLAKAEPAAITMVVAALERKGC